MNFKKQTAEQHYSRSHLIKGKLMHVPICLCTEKKNVSRKYEETDYRERQPQ